ncbi:MAG: IMP dehydrogenase [Erysipelotrichaceae bacterium]|nr:IMP dehydrogenase [Erysipelotrichaceae bacterium]
MNGKILKQGYTFDDVLLVPAFSKVVPAKVKLKTQLTSNIKLNIPICAAAMDTVCEETMALALAKLGGIGFIHKNMTSSDQADMVVRIKSLQVDQKDTEAALDNKGRYLVGAAVGVSDQMIERVDALVAAEVDIISVDSAHGHSQGVIDAVRQIRQKYPQLDIVGGNIVTAQGAIDLFYAGANVVKVGVGPGSICTTRVVAGVGVPQLTAVNDVFQVAKTYGIGVIADGGIKLSGDIVKALAAGSDCVMLGGLLAGCDEAPGEVITINDKAYKSYVGMGSLSAMKRGSSDRYFQGGKKELSKLVPEGIEAMVPYKGSVVDVVYQMMGGLRSGMGYCGCETVSDLKDKASFVSISNAGLRESHPHDVENIQEAPNYNGR